MRSGASRERYLTLSMGNWCGRVYGMKGHGPPGRQAEYFNNLRRIVMSRYERFCVQHGCLEESKIGTKKAFRDFQNHGLGSCFVVIFHLLRHEDAIQVREHGRELLVSTTLPSLSHDPGICSMPALDIQTPVVRLVAKRVENPAIATSLRLQLKFRCVTLRKTVC
jgi:hypothetical protein